MFKMNSFSWRRFLGGALALWLVCHAVACSFAAQTATPARKNYPTPLNRVEVEVVGAEESVTITFPANETEWPRYQPLITEFERQHPEIQVELVAWPEDLFGDDLAYSESLYRMAAVADTLLIGGGAFNDAPAAFQDLQSLADADPAFAADDFWPGALDACRDPNGRLLGLPIGIRFQGIFYDASAYDSVGLPRPTPGWTWDDFRAAVDVLAQPNADPSRYAYAENFPTLPVPLIAAALAQEGGQVIPATLQQAVGWYIQFIQTGKIYLPPGGGIIIQGDSPLPDSDFPTLFQAKTHPLMWPGTLEDSLPGTADSPPAFLSQGFAPFPSSDEMPRTSPAWADCIAVSAGSRAPRQAWQWINFLTQHWLGENSPRESERLAVPGSISAADASAYWQQFPPDLAPTIRYILQHAWYGSDDTLAQNVVTKAVWRATSGMDFTAALGEAQDYLASLPPTPTPPAAGMVATPQPTLPPGVTAVRYFYDSFGAESQALQIVAAHYNREHPEVQIRVTTDFSFPSGADRMALTAENFDCFTDMAWGGREQIRDHLLLLDTFFDAQRNDFTQDFDPLLLALYENEDSLYALPALADVQVMAYNADLLAKRGLKPPNPDWSFDEFVALAQAATSDTANDLSYGVLFNPMDDLFLAGHSALAADFQSDPPIPFFDSPAFANTLDWLAELHRAQVFLPYTSEWSQLQQAMINGKVAFWTVMLSDPGDWFDGQAPGYRVGLAPLPVVPAARFVSWGSKGHFISSHVDDPQACWDWIAYLSQQASVFKGIPARRSVAQSPAWEAVVGAQQAAIYHLALQNALQTSQNARPYSPISWPLIQWQAQAVTAMLQNEDYRTHLPILQQQATAYLACMDAVDRTHLGEAELRQEIRYCAQEADPGGNWGR
jgi:ABC-type glycerol-3-phosphate transport system substrate-binding protein